MCREWLRPITSGLVRQHPRSGPKCAGSGMEDGRKYLVWVPLDADGTGRKYPTTFQMTGRRSAEIVAASAPGAIVYERA